MPSLFTSRVLQTPERVRGFSLAELLASLAVLAVLMIMVTQIVGSAVKGVESSRRQLDARSQSQAAFNLLAGDLASLVRQPGLDLSAFKHPGYALPDELGGSVQAANPQVGNDRMAFYSESVGAFTGSVHPTEDQRGPISLVAYRVADTPGEVPSLQRRGLGLGWEPSSTNGWEAVAYLPTLITDQWPALFKAGDGYETVGGHVFRVEYCYLLKADDSTPAALSTTPWRSDAAGPMGFSDVAAIVVTLAILDDDSGQLVSDYTALIDSLPDAVDGASPAQAWNAIVYSESFATAAQIPAWAASSVRIFERYFYLDGI